MAGNRGKSYTKFNVIGACICVLSPIPLFVGVFTDKDFYAVVMFTVTLLLVGIGVIFFVISGGRWESMQKLLKEGEFSPEEKRRSRMKEKVAPVYWLSATAVYLGWSFWTNDWEKTWIVWPIAGILFAVVICICNLLLDRENKGDKQK